MTSTFNRRSFAIRAGWGVLALAGAVGIVLYVRWLVSVDPFARFRPNVREPLGGQIGVRLEDVKLTVFSAEQLIGECKVGRVDVRRDRQKMDLYAIADGRYVGKEGDVRFSGPTAEYDASRGMLRASQGARVWNADMDLTSGEFAYHERQERLIVPGNIRGKLFGGEVIATRLEYFPRTGAYATGPIEWTGEIEALEQEAAQGRRVKWTIKAVGSAKAKGDVEEYQNVEATDGEVLLKAPKVELNRKTDVLKATGRVYYYGLDANLVCDEVTVYRKEKRAVLVGNVTMLVKPEEEERLEVVEIPPFQPVVPEEIARTRPPAPQRTSEEQKKQEEEIRSTKNLRKYPISVHAERIEYWYKKGERHAQISGSPEAFQGLPNDGWRRAWAPKAYYDGEKETLKMISSEGKRDTRVKTSVGDDLVATWFLVSTKKGQENEWEGEGIEGDVIINEEEDRPGGRSGTQPPPAAKPPPLKGDIGRAKRGG